MAGVQMNGGRGILNKPEMSEEINGSADVPPPQQALGDYSEVVADKEFFYMTLQVLHQKCNTSFTSPIVGDKPVDLHMLFVEVTSRGGMEKVIENKEWKDVIRVLIPYPIPKNASSIIRKHYNSILHPYEQIYFPKSMANPNGVRVFGTIDGQFDSGYFVTVNVLTMNGKIMKGVLFPTGKIEPVGSTFLKRKNSSCKVQLDPTLPKKNRSGYTFFFADQYARIKPLNIGTGQDITKEIGHLWRNLQESEKAAYKDLGLKDKERYENEMRVSKERNNSLGGEESSSYARNSVE